MVTYEVVFDVDSRVTRKFYEYGETPQYFGSTEKVSSDDVRYAFIGWDLNNDGAADELPATVTQDIYAVALFRTTPAMIDINDDGLLNISDVSELLNILSGAGNADMQKCDINGDGTLNISDVSELLNILSGN